GAHLSAPEFLPPELDSGDAAAGGTAQRPKSGSAAAPGQHNFAAGAALAGVCARLSVRNSMVRRDLLLGVQYHEAIRRDQCRRGPRSADLVLPVFGPLSRAFRSGDQHSVQVVSTPGTRALPVGLGGSGAGA